MSIISPSRCLIKIAITSFHYFQQTPGSPSSSPYLSSVLSKLVQVPSQHIPAKQGKKTTNLGTGTEINSHRNYSQPKNPTPMTNSKNTISISSHPIILFNSKHQTPTQPIKTIQSNLTLNNLGRSNKPNAPIPPHIQKIQIATHTAKHLPTTTKKNPSHPFQPLMTQPLLSSTNNNESETPSEIKYLN